MKLDRYNFIPSIKYYMLQAGAHVNAGMPETPLIAAATAGLIDIIECLLKAGANANITDMVSFIQPEFSIF